MAHHEGFTNIFLVSKMLEGMRRVHKTVDTGLPISDELLGLIIKTLPSICISDFEVALFASAFSLSMVFLRVGEVALNKEGQAKQVIKIENIKLIKEGGKEKILVHLPFTKTEQHGKGPVLDIYAQIGSDICPIYLLKKYLTRRSSNNGPLYCHFSGKPVTRYQFSVVLNKALRGMGIDSSKIKTHSFRIGAASYHFERGTQRRKLKY